MATLKQWAEAYEAKQLRNIAELDSCNVSLEVKHDTIGEGDEKREYQYVEIDGEKYEVKKSVTAQLQALIKSVPNLDKFKVIKSGEGMKTRYQVLPLV